MAGTTQRFKATKGFMTATAVAARRDLEANQFETEISIEVRVMGRKVFSTTLVGSWLGSSLKECREMSSDGLTTKNHRIISDEAHSYIDAANLTLGFSNISERTRLVLPDGREYALERHSEDLSISKVGGGETKKIRVLLNESTKQIQEIIFKHQVLGEIKITAEV